MEDDKSGLIGHSLNRSCTFLSNIALRENFIIVDWPGFSDTNGLVTSLGVNPKIETLRKYIQEKEKEFLKRIGIEKIIRFSELDDPNLLSSCIAMLSEPQDKQIASRTYALLDCYDRGYETAMK